MEIDVATATLTVLGTAATAAFWKPLFAMLTGRSKARERDIDKLDARLDSEIRENKAALQRQIDQLQGQVAALTAQNAAQQKMITDQNAEIKLLQFQLKNERVS